MTFILYNHTRPNMALYGEKSSITKDLTLRVIKLAFMGSTMSPKDTIVAPLNLDMIQPRFSKANGGYPICF